MPNEPVTDKEMMALMEEQFKKLPDVVRNAITSADISAHLRKLADTYKMHVDKWNQLDMIVMLTLLGFFHPQDLAEHLTEKAGIEKAIAEPLALAINNEVFQPIREELNRQLGAPSAKEEATTGVEQVRKDVLSTATPAAPAPTEKVERAPISSSYTSTHSTERKTVEGDPYREQVV